MKLQSAAMRVKGLNKLGRTGWSRMSRRSVEGKRLSDDGAFFFRYTSSESVQHFCFSLFLSPFPSPTICKRKKCLRVHVLEYVLKTLSEIRFTLVNFVRHNEQHFTWVSQRFVYYTTWNLDSSCCVRYSRCVVQRHKNTEKHIKKHKHIELCLFFCRPFRILFAFCLPFL